jgi:hypothetical protein
MTKCQFREWQMQGALSYTMSETGGLLLKQMNFMTFGDLS